MAYSGLPKMYFEDPDVSGGAYQPVMSDGGDPDVTGGTYQPTVTIGDPTGVGDARYYGDGTPGSSNSSGFSMSDLPQWLQDAVGSVGGSLSNYAKDPNLLAAIAGAWNSYNTADKYGEMGKSLREEGNPFGQYRPTYGEGLMELYKDPSSLENSAAYQARMRAGLNTLGPQLAAKGGGFGNMGGEMIKYASDLASTEYDKEWQRRFNAAGGQFGPDASLNAQLQAARLEAEAKNAALDQLFTPFGRKPDGGNGGGSGGGSGGGEEGFNPHQTGNDGGSGGGAVNSTQFGLGTVGPPRQGFNGATGGVNGGGGGGASQIAQGQNGGSGSLSSITGTSTFYAGGGGGSGNDTFGTGGPGGGGNGAVIVGSTPGDPGVDGLGGGGGGGVGTGARGFGGIGGSGIVILRYQYQ